MGRVMASVAHPSLPFDETHDSSPRHDDRLLSVEELADYLEVPVKTIYTWRHRNTGPKGFRVGKHVRFRWHDVQSWVAQRIADEN
ncbi:MAG TPA: helix-turn-helix domain-containing protein [Acidimicrobiia bacterium]|nr:helix-turn-helix domain-containing protein [Acidimicrobiia bacterium]